ncbi:MAG: hypothetical protein Q9195_009184, partial [Heterodermia aff. obscurata]
MNACHPPSQTQLSKKTRSLREIILADKHTLTEKEVERIVLLSIKFNRLTSDAETYAAADEDVDEERIYPDSADEGSDDEDYSCLGALGSNDGHDVGVDLRPFLTALDLLLESIFSSWLPGASLRDLVDCRRTTPRRYPKAIAKLDEGIMRGLEGFAGEGGVGIEGG